MFFYVYLDPQVISEANEKGPDAVGVLTSLLRDLSQNCLLVDFENHYVRNDIREILGGILGDFEVARLKTVLGQFAKRKLFAPSLTYDWSPDKSKMDMALGQLDVADLDFIIISVEAADNWNGTRVSDWSTFEFSEFEERRRFSAVNGTELPDGAIDASSFFEEHLRRPLRFASKIEIIDRQCGEKYKDNYDYSVGKLLEWIGSVNKEEPKITFHVGFPGGRESTVVSDSDFVGVPPEDIEGIKHSKLLAAIKRHAPAADIHLECYVDGLPHQRYVVTDQVAFSIDVGVDFLNPKNGRNRRLSMSVKSGDTLLKELP